MCSVIIYWFHEVLYTTYFYLLNEKKLSGSFRHTMYYSYTLHIVQYSGGLRMSKEPRESLMRPHRPIFFLGHVSSSPLPPCVVSASKYHYYTYTTFGLRGYFRRSLWWWKNICRGRSRCIVVAASFFVITGWQQPHHTVVVQYSDTAMYYRTKERRKKGVSWCDVCV